MRNLFKIAIRNLIRENNKHMLETVIQTGGKHYCKC